MNPTIKEQIFEIHATVESLQGQLEEDGGESAHEARLALSRINGQLLEFLRTLDGVQIASRPKRRGRRGRKPAAPKQEDARQMVIQHESPKNGETTPSGETK